MANQGTTMPNSLIKDVADLAEAIRALQRVCGFNHNHDTLLLALLAAAREHGSNQFQASYAEIGARMCGEVQPYKNNLTPDEQDKRKRALSERFRRAYRNLETDQRETGLTFVTVQCGGRIKGENQKSRMQVDIDSIMSIVDLARQSKDFSTFPIRCFERAADKVRDSKERRYIDPALVPVGRRLRTAEDRIRNIKRYGRCIETYARKLYQYAVEDNFSKDKLDALKEALKLTIDNCFADYSPAQLEGERVHESVPHINNIEDTNPCTPNVNKEAENISPPVTLNGSLIEAIENDTGADERPLDSAMLALDIVASIGASGFRAILVNDATKKCEVLTKKDIATLEKVKAEFPVWLERSEREQKSLVVDMKPNGQRIIQVDEANAEVMKLLAPVSFMTVETSDGNGQVWLALPEGLSDTEIADVKDRLFVLLKAKGANKGASGGLRWVGTRNFKPERKRADGTYPLVRLLDYKDGRIVTTYELESLGLLAEPQPKISFKPKADGARQSLRAKRPPSYQRAIESVRRKENGEIDRSAVDAHYAVLCLNWGFDEAETERLLKENSSKAQERGDTYIESVLKFARKRSQVSPSVS